MAGGVFVTERRECFYTDAIEDVGEERRSCPSSNKEEQSKRREKGGDCNNSHNSIARRKGIRLRAGGRGPTLGRR